MNTRGYRKRTWCRRRAGARGNWRRRTITRTARRTVAGRHIGRRDGPRRGTHRHVRNLTVVARTRHDATARRTGSNHRPTTRSRWRAGRQRRARRTRSGAVDRRCTTLARPRGHMHGSWCCGAGGVDRAATGHGWAARGIDIGTAHIGGARAMEMRVMSMCRCVGLRMRMRVRVRVRVWMRMWMWVSMPRKRRRSRPMGMGVSMSTARSMSTGMSMRRVMPMAVPVAMPVPFIIRHITSASASPDGTRDTSSSRRGPRS